VGLSATAAKADTKAMTDDTAVRQAQLKRQFEQFRLQLALVAGRMENGSAKDREKARALRAALEVASVQGVAGKFEAIIALLTGKGADQDSDVLLEVLRTNAELRKDLQRMLALIGGDRDKELAQQRDRALALLAKLKELRGKQARLQARVERGGSKPQDLLQEQQKITAATREVLQPADKDKAARLDGERSPQEVIRKPVQKAIQKQRQAEGQLGKGNTEGAGDDQGEAVARLDEAIRELEKILNSIRKEEKERLLAGLLARVEKMLAIQTEVNDQTEKLDGDIRRTKDGKPELAHSGRANQLADREEEVFSEAEAALQVLQSEGSAAAFTLGFQQVRKDAQNIKVRLGRADTGSLTRAIEADVLETLKEMREALKKAIKENEQNPPPPRPRPPPDSKPPLVDLMQELKMVLGLQKRVHERTRLYGRLYKGEQAPSASRASTPAERTQAQMIQKELRDLAQRQDRIGKVTKTIAVKVRTGERR
jgi:hypothetical protein